MAEEKKVLKKDIVLRSAGKVVRTAKADKPEKKNGFQKFIAGIAGIPKRIQNSVLSTWRELKKVTWPTRKELINYSVVVLVFIALLGVLVGLLDLGASAFIKLLIQA